MYGVVGLDFFGGKNEEERKGLLLFQKMFQQRLFLEPVGFAAQPFDPVAVYSKREVPGRNGETGLHRGSARGQGTGMINHPIRKNRKRFPFPKKRFNKFPAF